MYYSYDIYIYICKTVHITALFYEKTQLILSVLTSQISNLFHSFLLIYTPNVFGLLYMFFFCW